MAEKGGGDKEGVFVGLHFLSCVFDEQDCHADHGEGSTGEEVKRCKETTGDPCT